MFSNKPDPKLTVRIDDAIPPRTVSQKDIYSTRRAVWAVSGLLEDVDQRDLLNRLLPMVMVDNLRFDETDTQDAREDNRLPYRHSALGERAVLRARHNCIRAHINDLIHRRTRGGRQANPEARHQHRPPIRNPLHR